MLGLKKCKWKTNPLIIRTMCAAFFPEPSSGFGSCALRSFSAENSISKVMGYPETLGKEAAP